MGWDHIDTLLPVKHDIEQTINNEEHVGNQAVNKPLEKVEKTATWSDIIKQQVRTSKR